MRVPIGASGLATAPASIALWSFDEFRGRWPEERVATRDGDTYRASLPHLSWWNFDVAYLPQTTCVFWPSLRPSRRLCSSGAPSPRTSTRT